MQQLKIDDFSNLTADLERQIQKKSRDGVTQESLSYYQNQTESDRPAPPMEYCTYAVVLELPSSVESAVEKAKRNVTYNLDYIRAAASKSHIYYVGYTKRPYRRMLAIDGRHPRYKPPRLVRIFPAESLLTAEFYDDEQSARERENQLKHELDSDKNSFACAHQKSKNL